MAMHAMIQGYHDAGWEVYLLSMHTLRHSVGHDVLKTLYPWLAGFETVDIDNRIKPIPTLVNLIFSRQPNHAARFFNISFKERLEHILRDFKPDVVQMESIFLASYLPYIREHGKVTTVLRLHNIEYQVWQRLARQVRNLPKKGYLNNLSKRIKNFEEAAWEDADVLLPITEVDAELVRKAGTNAKIVVAPYGIDMGIGNTQGSSEKWNGYHIGAMDWLPNTEAIDWFLKDVWPGLHKEVPEFKFYFAGRNMPESFKRISIPGVSCMGEVENADEFIADKKILIVPLHSGGGIRVKILEAMARGKVVISTAVGMQGINAAAGKHYLLADDAKGFTDAVKWALEHKAEAEVLGRNAAQLVSEQYSQAAIMKSVIQGLESHLAH
jgi:glycosyltransferase involved in cell wall biosynthesis